MSLKPSQIQAAILLSEGKKQKEVAESVGCTQETISHWKQLPSFEALLNSLRLDALESAREAIRFNVGAAVSTLAELCVSAGSEEVRRKASVNLIEVAGVIGAVQEWGIGPTTEEAALKARYRRLLAAEIHADPIEQLVNARVKKELGLTGTTLSSVPHNPD
jgi:hypothetical protein